MIPLGVRRVCICDPCVCARIFFRQKARVTENIITFAKIYSADVLLMIQISSTIRFSHEIINYQIIKDTMIALYACRVRSCKYVVFIIHFALCKNITF